MKIIAESKTELQTIEHLERFCQAFRKAGDAAKVLKLSDQTLSNYRSERPKTKPGASVRERMREAGYDFATGRLIVAVEPGESKESVIEKRGLRADSDIIRYVMAVEELPPIREAVLEYESEKQKQKENIPQEEKQTIQFFRSIDPKENTFVPFFGSAASAGDGKDVFPDIVQFIDVAKNYHKGTFFVAVQGDSLRDMGITEKHRLLIDTTIEPRSGMLVLARRGDGDDFLVKQFKMNGRGWLLCPANPAYSPIEVNADIKIIGVVMEIVLRLVG